MRWQHGATSTPISLRASLPRPCRNAGAQHRLQPAPELSSRQLGRRLPQAGQGPFPAAQPCRVRMASTSLLICSTSSSSVPKLCWPRKTFRAPPGPSRRRGPRRSRAGTPRGAARRPRSSAGGDRRKRLPDAWCRPRARPRPHRHRQPKFTFGPILKLAVGKPSLRPRRSPTATIPSTEESTYQNLTSPTRHGVETSERDAPIRYILSP